MAATVAINAFAPSNPQHGAALDSPVLLNLLIVDKDRFVREACREAAAVLGYRATATEAVPHAVEQRFYFAAHPTALELNDAKDSRDFGGFQQPWRKPLFPIL